MPNPSLENVQRWLKWAITHPKGASTALHEGDFEPMPSCAPYIASFTPEQRHERIDIYGRAYFLRLTSYMREAYEKTVCLADRLKQRPLLETWITEYLILNPSQSPNLDALGLGFSDFVGTHASDSCDKDSRLLVQMICLERAVLFAALRSCLPARAAQSLQSLSEDQIGSVCPVLDATVSLVRVSLPMLDVWRAPTTAPLPAAMSEQALVVWRDLTGELRLQAVEASAMVFLEALAQHARLGELSAEVDAQRVGEWFRDWVENGIIRDITLLNA